jgi:hypothetical protein
LKEQKATPQKANLESKRQDKSYSDPFSRPSKSPTNEAAAEKSNGSVESAEVVSGYKDEARNQPDEKKPNEEKPKEVSSLESSISKDPVKLEEEVPKKISQPSLPAEASATSSTATSPATTPVQVSVKDTKPASPPPSFPSTPSVFQRITNFFTKSEPDPPPPPKSAEVDKTSQLHDASAPIPAKPTDLSSPATAVDRDHRDHRPWRDPKQQKEYRERRAEQRAEQRAAKERRLKNPDEVPVRNAQNETTEISTQEAHHAKPLLDTSQSDQKMPSSNVTSDQSSANTSKLDHVARAKGNGDPSPPIPAQSSEPKPESITKTTVEPPKQPYPERPKAGFFGRLFRAVKPPAPVATVSDEDAKPLKLEAQSKVEPQIKSQLRSRWALPVGLTWPDPKPEPQVEEEKVSPVKEATVNEREPKEPTPSTPPSLQPRQRHIIPAVEATFYTQLYSRILTPYIPPSETPFAKLRPEPLLPAFSTETKNKNHSRNSSLIMAQIPHPKKDTAVQPIEHYAECLRSIRPAQISTVDVNTLWESTLGLLRFERGGKVGDRELREWVRHTVYNMLELAGRRKEEKDRIMQETRSRRVVEKELEEKAKFPVEKSGWYQLTENAMSAEAKSEMFDKSTEGLEHGEGAPAESAEIMRQEAESVIETTSTPAANIESAADSRSTETTFPESREDLIASTEFVPDTLSTGAISKAMHETTSSKSVEQSLESTSAEAVHELVSTEPASKSIESFITAESAENSVPTETTDTAASIGDLTETNDKKTKTTEAPQPRFNMQTNSLLHAALKPAVMVNCDVARTPRPRFNLEENCTSSTSEASKDTTREHDPANDELRPTTSTSEPIPTTSPAYPPPYPSPSIVIPLPDKSLPKSSTSEDTANNKTWSPEQPRQQEQRAS